MADREKMNSVSKIRRIRRIRDILRNVNTDEELAEIHDLLDQIQPGMDGEGALGKVKTTSPKFGQKVEIEAEDGSRHTVFSDHISPSDVNDDGTVSFPLDGCPSGACNP